MGGGRSPCCDKTKVKRGPWSPAEDVRLVSFIQKHGHPNWRSLPKQAGLLRCGKSCRLRWINYLRPDLKRGNFTVEEEHSIIRLHATFGNRWSKIASHLPGRTDNEIKNVWNTHLKKRLQLMNNNNDNKNEAPSSSFASVQEKTLTIEDTDQPSTPSSTISCNSVQDNPNSTWDTDNVNTPLFDLDELEIITNSLEIPLEYEEVEFWNMLEPQLISDHEMLEVEKWVRSLEMELGLMGSSSTAGASQQINEQDGRTQTMCNGGAC